MDIDARLSISFYKTIATISEEHKVYIVQHNDSRKIFVKKVLSVYNGDVYDYLKSHPITHTPHIYEIYEEDGELTVIEEYISGDTLEQLLDANKAFDDEQIQKYLIQLCCIVSKLHGCVPSIVHRDIKPSNIIISPSGELYLLDFNAAKYQSDKREDTTLLGTKGYAAPEQYGFGVSTVQTDIYAIGMLLCNLANGSLSFEYPAAGKYASIIEKCTQLNPYERYPDVNSILEALGVNTISDTNISKITGWKSFLPPGFRELSPINMIFSGIGYFFVFWLSLSLEIKDSNPALLCIERIFCLLVFLSVIFCSGNYRNVQSLFPPCRTKNKLLHFLAVILLDILVALSFLTLMSILATIIM